MKTPREMIHEAMRAASKRGCGGIPACAFRDSTETMLCDELVAAVEALDAEVRAAALEEAAQLCDEAAAGWERTGRLTADARASQSAVLAMRIRSLALVSSPASTPRPPERAAALAETEAIAVAVRYMALRDIPHIFVTSAAPYFDRIVDDIRALAAPASTPKPPESAEPCGRYERGPVAYMCRNCGDHVDRHLQASQFSAAPPKGEAPKAKCHTCEGDGKVGRPRNATTCPTCRGTGDAP